VLPQVVVATNAMFSGSFRSSTSSVNATANTIDQRLSQFFSKPCRRGCDAGLTDPPRFRYRRWLHASQLDAAPRAPGSTVPCHAAREGIFLRQWHYRPVTTEPPPRTARRATTRVPARVRSRRSRERNAARDVMVVRAGDLGRRARDLERCRSRRAVVRRRKTLAKPPPRMRSSISRAPDRGSASGIRRSSRRRVRAARDWIIPVIAVGALSSALRASTSDPRGSPAGAAGARVLA
jgi:hypothetical protein